MTNFFQKLFFSKYLKNRVRYRKSVQNKSVGLLIYNNLLPGHILITKRFWDTAGSKKTQTTPPPLILGKYYPDCAVQGKLLISNWNKYFKRISTQVKTFLRPLAPVKLFSKSVFSKYLKNRFRHCKKISGIKFVDLQILRRQGLLCYSISFMVCEIEGFKEFQKSTPYPN